MKTRFLTLTVIILAAGGMRLLPHPPNVTPIAAIALFGGALLEKRVLALIVPLMAMVISDLLLAATLYGSAAFNMVTPFVYGGFCMTVGLGRVLRRRRTPLRIVSAALAGSVLFFLLTNFGVWLRGALYPANWEGLVTCYIAAVPFFRNTILGDAFYTLVLFGGFALIELRIPVLKEKTV